MKGKIVVPFTNGVGSEIKGYLDLGELIEKVVIECEKEFDQLKQ